MSNAEQISQAIETLRRAVKGLVRENEPVPPILALPVASKKTMNVVSGPCKLCASLQGFYSEEMLNGSLSYNIPNGVYSIEELAKKASKEYGLCGFHLARKSAPNIIVCTHKTVLSPKLRNFYLASVEENSVVVFDEGHSIGKS